MKNRLQEAAMLLEVFSKATGIDGTEINIKELSKNPEVAGKFIDLLSGKVAIFYKDILQERKKTGWIQTIKGFTLEGYWDYFYEHENFSNIPKQDYPGGYLSYGDLKNPCKLGAVIDILGGKEKIAVSLPAIWGVIEKHQSESENLLCGYYWNTFFTFDKSNELTVIGIKSDRRKFSSTIDVTGIEDNKDFVLDRGTRIFLPVNLLEFKEEK